MSQVKLITGRIYRITHVKSGKIYIGATSKYISSRFKEHIRAANDPNNHEAKSSFYQFVKGKKEDEFKVEQLDKLKDCSMKQLEDLEKQYIAKEDKKLLLNTEMKSSVDTSSKEYQEFLKAKKAKKKCEICDKSISHAHFARHRNTIQHKKNMSEKGITIKKAPLKEDEMMCGVCDRKIKKNYYEKHCKSQKHVNLSKIK